MAKSVIMWSRLMRVCRHGSEETICLHVINYVIICNILSKQHVDIMFIVDGVS